MSPITKQPARHTRIRYEEIPAHQLDRVRPLWENLIALQEVRRQPRRPGA
ncbi:MAG: hypothetical protein KGS61_07355 [Verrucomicrobia bacterium]|nr:hypothetical protein [Verrucomicrobiota bacterium]